MQKRADIPDDLARRFQLAYNALLETAVALQIQSTVNRILATGDASSLGTHIRMPRAHAPPHLCSRTTRRPR